MKRFLLCLILLLSPLTAWAVTCTCSGGTCTDTTATNWSCGAFPTAADDVVISATGTVDFAGATWTVNTINIEAGGTFNCSGAGAQTLTVDNVATVQGIPSPLYVAGGATFACGTGSNGAKTIIFSGTNVATGSHGLAWQTGGTASNLPATDANITFRGVQRLVGAATGTSEPTDMKTCMDAVVISGTVAAVSVADTIAFTSGKSRGFKYPVACKPDACTGAGAPVACCTAADTTANCSATACGGGPCDIELNRADSTSKYNGLSIATGSGGPERHPTPVDSDANGVADGINTRPGTGDAFEVYTPSVFKGSAPGFATGASIVWEGVNADLRYLDIFNLAGNSNACTADGFSGVHLGIIKSASAEGDISFLNIYDWVSQVGMEINRTDDSGDGRANYGWTGRHWTVHDYNNAVEACANQELGQGISVTLDNGGDTYSFSDVVLEDLRVYNVTARGIAFLGPQATTARGVIVNDVLLRRPMIYNIPANTTYPLDPPSPAAIALSHARDFRIEAPAVWDIGNLNDTWNVITMTPWADGTVVASTEKNQFRVDNAFLVNWDGNGNINTTSPAVDFALGLSGASANTGTSHNIVSNSYIANGVGIAARGGGLMFSYVRDTNIANAGACGSSLQGAILLPETSIGNVLRRTSATSCWNVGILVDDGGLGSQPSIYADKTRRITSNVIDSPSSAVGVFPASGVGIRNNILHSRNVDIYHNVINTLGNTGVTPRDLDLNFGAASTATATYYYNVLIGGSTNGVRQGSAGTYDHNYNRFIQAGATPISGGSLGANDLDVDLSDIFTDTATSLYSQTCDTTERTRNPWGGPVGPLWFGIRSFAGFHPAVLASMNAEAFKLRYDWRECGAAFQDAVPR